MPAQEELAKLSALDFAERFRAEMVPLGSIFSYFSAIPLSEEDLKEYLDEPIAALPPAIKSGLPKTYILLVPYLERASGRPGEFVTFEKPGPKSQAWAAHFTKGGEATLVFGIKDQEVADYHYIFYRTIAMLVADRFSEAQERYRTMLKEELRSNVHGEVDEEGWELKQLLVRGQNETRRDTKPFRNYLWQSFVDTLTLYMHGICCDIDVETGPRQLPSRYIRKRLQLLYEVFPPPEGYAVFPEQLNKA